MARIVFWVAGALMWASGCRTARMRTVPLEAMPASLPAKPPLWGMWGGPGWPTAQVEGSCIDPETGDPVRDGIGIEPGWCVRTENVRWSDGAKTITTRPPIGMEFDASAGIVDLGGGDYATGCHRSLIRWSDPPLICMLELHEEIGLLRVSRIVPVPLPDQARLPGLASWAAQRGATSTLLGERIGDDLIVAFPDSLALVSLVEWAPEPPSVCTWGIDYCPDGVVVGNRLIDLGDHTFAIELECDQLLPETLTDVSAQTYCAICTLSAFGHRGETRPAETFRQGSCAEEPL